MKKYLIGIALFILFALGFLYFLGRNKTAEENLPSDSPFGNAPENVNIGALGSNTVGTQTQFDENVPASTTVFRLSNTPTAGFVILTKGSETFVRFVDRATGHIFDIILPKNGASATLEKRRVTNNTLPKVYEALFRADGGAVVLRQLEDDGDVIKNLALTLTPPKGTSTELYNITATNLRGSLDSLMSSGNTLYSVAKDSGVIGSSNFTGGESRTLFTSPFDNWRLERLGTNLLVYTKASFQAPGYAYSLPGGGGSLTRLLGPLNGLTAKANAAGNRLIYSFSANNFTKLYAKNISSGANIEILPASLAEKCVWSARNSAVFFCGTPLGGLTGAEPDNWYLGRTHFSDYVWRFDTQSELSQLVAEPKTEYGLDLDISEPKLTANEDFMVFINKRDLTLWAIKLN